jgi:fimbrial isopeptide formation D2 family protein
VLAAGVAALLVVVTGVASTARGETVRELTGRWADGTADSVRQGEVLNSEWRLNLNDSPAAPANEPVDNVFVTLTAHNGTFTAIPDACLTTGVVPVSAISGDGGTLVCNLGRHKQGTAVAIEVPVVASGAAGSKVSLSGTFGEATAATTPVPIVRALKIDFKLNDQDAWYEATGTSDHLTIEFPWSLYLGDGSLVGPDTVTYTITTAGTNGAAVRSAAGTYGCAAFTTPLPLGASGHPWSGGGHPADQTANTVGTCTLAYTAANTYTLTLSGIDWSPASVPTKDSAGKPLPADRLVVASGVISFQLNPADNGATAGVNVTASAPTYTSPADPAATVVDDASNNNAGKVISFFSGWSGIWGRGGTGTTSWDDQLRKSAGATLSTYMDAALPRTASRLSECTVLDARYVTLQGPAVVKPVGGTVEEMGPVDVAYYVGTSPAELDPGSASYDPDAVGTCGALPDDGWVTSLPADLSTVRAVRSSYDALDMTQLDRIALSVPVTIHGDVRAGQDIWVWHSYAINGVWSRLSDSVTQTKGARYPYTTKSRDLLRVVEAWPAVTKTADKSPLRMGEEVTYTLTYSANGGTSIASTVSSYKLVDRLPAGLTYVEGSATPAPAVSTSGGHQVLTWMLSDVPTNTVNTLTYKATTNARTVAGQVLKNSVVSTIVTDPATGTGLDSTPAEASVTVSTSGATLIGKSADQAMIPNLTGNGSGTGSWTVTLRSDDPSGQTFTDVIDVLPYNGDSRGTSFSGDYELTDVIGEGTIYYTTADPAGLSDDPADASNGRAGDVSGNTADWTTTKPADATSVTAVRVIAAALPAAEARSYQIVITTVGAKGGDVYVNRAQGRASHTELVMRTSAPTRISQYYAYDLKKYVRDAAGSWHDAQDTNDADWPLLQTGQVSAVAYKIVVTNTGQGDLTDIAVKDSLFPAVDYTIAELKSGASDEHEFTVDLSSHGERTVRNVATAHAPLPPGSTQPGLPDVSDEANVTVTPRPAAPGFTLTKVAAPVSGTEVTEGDSITYTVTGTNTGNTVLDPVTITDDLTDVLDNATLVAGSVTASRGELPVATADTLSWTGRLDVGQDVVITYRVVVKAGQGGQLIHNHVHGEAVPPNPDNPDRPGTPIVPPDVETRHPIPAQPSPSPSVTPTGGPTSGSTPGTPDEDHLAYTGADVIVSVFFGLGLLIVGGAVMAASRAGRRRN